MVILSFEFKPIVYSNTGNLIIFSTVHHYILISFPEIIKNTFLRITVLYAISFSSLHIKSYNPSSLYDE